MKDSNSLKTEKKTLCEVLEISPICNGSCKVHLYFSERMDYYTKELFNLQAGPPKEVLLYYANPFYYNCALKFSVDLDNRMISYLEQINPRAEVTNKKPSIGFQFFDFSRVLRDIGTHEQPLVYFLREFERKDSFDSLSDPLRSYVNRKIDERIQDSSLKFLVYACPEDENLAKRVVQVINHELALKALIKPTVVVKHVHQTEFSDSYTIDIDYFIHEAIKMGK